MTMPSVVRRISAPVAVVAMVYAGCARPPEAPPAAASKPPAATGHDADHDHAHDDHDHAHDDHDHAHGDDHEHPQTLAEGVTRLAALAGSVKEHLAADARDDADEAVHDMGHLLEDLHELVRTSDLAADAKAAATRALDELFECFNALDEALHAKPGEGEPPVAVHATVAERIEAAIEALAGPGRNEEQDR